MAKSYHFHISGSYSPATIPLERLGEYMTQLGRLLGEPAHVHLGEVTEGSVGLLAKIDDPAQPKVADRVDTLRSGTAPKDVRKAFDELDEMLRKDNAYGSLEGEGDAVVIPFPGIKRPQPITYGPFRQEGTLDGQIFRIGGEDDSKHIGIRDGAKKYSVLVADEAMALRLRHHLFGSVLRFHGTGTWLRHADGSWELKGFKVLDFDELDDAPLGEVVQRLRASSRGELSAVPDIIAKLLESRDDGAAH